MKNTFTGGALGSVSGKNYSTERLSPAAQQQIPIAVSKRSNLFSHLPIVMGVFSKMRAKFVVRDVKNAMKEVELIEKGIKKPKTLDQLLDEL